jgi:hypothetical protein
MVQHEESLAQLESKARGKVQPYHTLKEEVSIGSKLAEEKCEWEEGSAVSCNKPRRLGFNIGLAHSHASTGKTRHISGRKH